MAIRRIYRGFYLEGYWGNKKVGIPIPYAPNHDLKDHVFADLEVDDDYDYREVINPSEVSLSKLREICEINHFPFFWVTGINVVNALPLTESLERAIDLFIAVCARGATILTYQRQFKRLIEKGGINPQATIAEYLSCFREAETAALKLGSKSYGFQVHQMLQSFHLFLEDPNYLRTKKEQRGKKSNNHYRAKRKDCLTEEEAKLFFPALKSINPKHELIARILWWFNHEICRDLETPTDAPIIPLESVLRMQNVDIGQDSLADIRADLSENAGGNSITVRSYNIYTEKQVCYYVPGKMYAQLSELARNTDLFLFRNKFGAPIDSSLVRRSFTKACKKANMRSITPNHLR